MIDYKALAAAAYAHAETNYGAKGARYDVIVECMERCEIVEALEEAGAATIDDAYKWADNVARLQHEQELNQAWDGPESCIGSPLYDPRHDPRY